MMKIGKNWKKLEKIEKNWKRLEKGRNLIRILMIKNDQDII